MVQRLLKWLGIHVHEWGPWEPQQYQITRFINSVKIGEPSVQDRQDRTCKTCGYRESREI